jgi:hypothetical protein
MRIEEQQPGIKIAYSANILVHNSCLLGNSRLTFEGHAE